MTDDPMIVKVAKAIAVTTGDTDWRVHIATARAAVKAMREPTSAMLEAAMPLYDALYAWCKDRVQALDESHNWKPAGMAATAP